ncbi:MAG TPA: HAD family hydrolase [Mycobacteriales bacterium]|nr:HAD family hydrolase [Mycobacteriales bacterium]
MYLNYWSRLPWNSVPVDGNANNARILLVTGLSYARTVDTERSPAIPAAAFFDLDKTVISTSSTLAFGRPFLRGGLIRRTDALGLAFWQMRYKMSGASATQMRRMRDQICARCEGWDVATVREIVQEHLPELFPTIVYPQAVELIESHRRAGRDIVVVSSGGAEVVDPIAVLLGADHVISTRLAIEDGRYSGKIEFYSVGPHKAAAMNEFAAAAGYSLAECYAYSDSVTDLPMLEAVGRPTAVNPDRGLRRAAEARGWPILRFRKPATEPAR